MEEKYNDATEQRPEGRHLLDASMVPLTCHLIWKQLNRNQPGRKATGMP